MTQTDSIFSIVREAEHNYTEGTTQLGKYVTGFNMYDNVEKIFAYLNFKHITGSTDSLGREKPFFDIVTAAVNIWYRATDLDRKDLIISPTKNADVVACYLASIRLQEWMRKSKFGIFLNEWGRYLASYGSATVKFVEQDGQLIPSVIPWNRFIADPINFDALPRIEKIFYTPEQLKKNKNYDQAMVKGLLSAVQTRETLENQNQDNYSNFIEVYEVHGNLPLSLLTDNPKDDEVYVQQMHVVSYVSGKTKGAFDDFTLYKGREKKDPYMITHLIPTEGRTQSIGAVEYLFEAQWMVNHSAKLIKDSLDLASRQVFQTADTHYIGRNVLTNLETGDILIHQSGSPLTQVPTNSHDITTLKLQLDAWKGIGQEITATPDALRGNSMPSGTPFALGEYLGSQSLSLFELMLENKGLYLEEMCRQFIIPFLKKGLNNSDEIVALLDDNGIEEIDAMYIPKAAVQRYNERFKNDLFNFKIPQPFNQQAEEQQIQGELSQLKNKRFFKPSEITDKTWKEVFDTIEWDVEFNITNEARDKATALTTLNSALKTLGVSPKQDPDAQKLFARIMRDSNTVSPLELSGKVAASPASAAPMA